MSEKNNEALAPVFAFSQNAFHWQPSSAGELRLFFRGATKRFIRKNGILLIVILALTVWTWMTCTIAAHNARVETEERLSAQYSAEYEAKIQAFYDAQEAAKAAENEALISAQAQMEREADALARLIGTMKTKRMKGAMLWNVLTRVDSPSYPDSVEEVIEQPSQWMFYSESNPIREDDRQFALEQLAVWHDGRYPAGLSSAFVYGEWSENDYVLRDSWDKNSRTNYWRFPE